MSTRPRFDTDGLLGIAWMLMWAWGVIVHDPWLACTGGFLMLLDRLEGTS